MCEVLPYCYLIRTDKREEIARVSTNFEMVNFTESTFSVSASVAFSLLLQLDDFIFSFAWVIVYLLLEFRIIKIVLRHKTCPQRHREGVTHLQSLSSPKTWFPADLKWNIDEGEPCRDKAANQVKTHNEGFRTMCAIRHKNMHLTGVPEAPHPRPRCESWWLLNVRNRIRVGHEQCVMALI